MTTSPPVGAGEQGLLTDEQIEALILRHMRLDCGVFSGVPELARAIEAAVIAADRAQRPIPAAPPKSPPYWADVVEDRLNAWRQRHMNRSGDRLALDDFMSQESIDDLIDFVCAPIAAPSAEGAEPVPTKRTLFQRMEDACSAEAEAERTIAAILGVELLGISFDDYDGSFEIFPDEDVIDVAPTKAQHDAIIALGCSRYWINFHDGGERWQNFNNGQLRKRAAEGAESKVVAELCMCKDRLKSACPGEWEPGCDLGSNEKFVRAFPQAESKAVEALRELVALKDLKDSFPTDGWSVRWNDPAMRASEGDYNRRKPIAWAAARAAVEASRPPEQPQADPKEQK